MILVPIKNTASAKQRLAAILDAAPPPRVELSPPRDAILLVESRVYPSIEELARPILRIGGLRIDPRRGCSQRLTHVVGLSVRPLQEGLPPARRIRCRRH